MAPVDGVRLVAEVVVGQLPQGLYLVEDHWQALKVGVESCRRLYPSLMDDASIHALDAQEAKP